MKLTEQDFHKIRDFIHHKTGIYFDDKKAYFVRKRLLDRVKEVGSDSCEEYLQNLKFSDPRGVELQAFVNALTTNETYFFREFNQLAVFAEFCLPLVVERKKKLGFKRLRIWSAGCSTGEEPYTLAIILREMLEDLDDWLIDIIATDIDTQVLATAAKGIYDNRAVKEVPPEYLAAWFTKTRDQKWRVHPKIKSMCRFQQLNFKNFDEIRAIVNVDFLFCRNVLIYFDNTVRKEIIGCFNDSLTSGGYLFLGHSESVSRLSHAFVTEKKDSQILYVKPFVEEAHDCERKRREK